MMKSGISSKIPKLIHFCWIQGFDHIPDDRINGIGDWSQFNEGYEIEFWGEERILDEIDEPYKSEYLKVKLPVRKSDFARCWILAKYGGWYMDVDLVPRRPLDEFLNDELVFGRLYKGQKEPINYHKYDYIFTREYRKIDKKGHAVANGCIGTIPSSIWTDFLEDRFEHRDKPVLTSFGPHALTHYLRPRIRAYNAVVIPPTYFLWERPWFGNPAPFCVSEHPSSNTWGDKTKKKWWEVE